MKRSGMRYCIDIAIVMIVVTGLDGCHLTKKTVKTAPVRTEDEKLVRSVFEATEPGRYLEFRYTGRAQMDEEKIPFLGTLKMVKDSIIWVSLRSSIGIELGRILARPDSVWMYSKLLKIQEKGDWKLVEEFSGYALDFKALQGILTQSLFTSSGNTIQAITADMTIRRKDESVWVTWKPEIEENQLTNGYLAQFRINPDTKGINEILIKDSKGQWAAKALYHFTKDNEIKKIEINGLDESHNYNAEINIVTREIKDKLIINFDYF
ncbi:MAG: DUF4292 domain-containing protein [Bacteroidota bacterium]